MASGNDGPQGNPFSGKSSRAITKAGTNRDFHDLFIEFFTFISKPIRVSLSSNFVHCFDLSKISVTDSRVHGRVWNTYRRLRPISGGQGSSVETPRLTEHNGSRIASAGPFHSNKLRSWPMRNSIGTASSMGRPAIQ